MTDTDAHVEALAKALAALDHLTTDDFASGKDRPVRKAIAAFLYDHGALDPETAYEYGFIDSQRLVDVRAMMASHWEPNYSSWRHGGWYVHNIRHVGGGCGCVSRNYADRKWRIVCDPRPGSFPGGDDDHTYPSREAAAHAERDLAILPFRVG